MLTSALLSVSGQRQIWVSAQSTCSPQSGQSGGKSGRDRTDRTDRTVLAHSQVSTPLRGGLGQPCSGDPQLVQGGREL